MSDASEYKSDISVVERLPGSLPMGGVVHNTPIYRTHNIEAHVLAESGNDVSATLRSPIKLDDSLAFVIDNVLSSKECEKIIQITEAMGYRPEAPGIQTPPGMRMNQSVHWLCEAPILNTIYHRIHHLLPQEIEGCSLHSRLSQRINFYKYQQGDVFNKHTDGAWPGFGFDKTGQRMIQWQDAESMLTMLLYLNDNFLGGETELFGRRKNIDVSPVTGSALFFRHGFGADSVVHSGKTITDNGNKYVARINILYNIISLKTLLHNAPV